MATTHLAIAIRRVHTERYTYCTIRPTYSRSCNYYRVSSTSRAHKCGITYIRSLSARYRWSRNTHISMSLSKYGHSNTDAAFSKSLSRKYIIRSIHRKILKRS